MLHNFMNMTTLTQSDRATSNASGGEGGEWLVWFSEGGFGKSTIDSKIIRYRRGRRSFFLRVLILLTGPGGWWFLAIILAERCRGAMVVGIAMQDNLWWSICVPNRGQQRGWAVWSCYSSTHGCRCYGRGWIGGGIGMTIWGRGCGISKTRIGWSSRGCWKRRRWSTWSFLSSLRCEEYEESAREEIPIWSLQSDLRVTQLKTQIRQVLEGISRREHSRSSDHGVSEVQVSLQVERTRIIKKEGSRFTG